MGRPGRRSRCLRGQNNPRLAKVGLSPDRWLRWSIMSASLLPACSEVRAGVVGVVGMGCHGLASARAGVSRNMWGIRGW